ncbi:N66 matrix protein-like [Helianthus annuus]|uniref:N66 matrix protein-like n=1 Tax=Helianthus annuus TaxID=4232 RepID=UPI000B8FB506|nr:N66 matrix protein-like [Helianthus annuus]
MVEPEFKRVERFIWVLAPQIMSMKKETHVESSGENKRKFSNFKKGTQGNNNSGNKKRDANPPAEVRTGAATAEGKGKGYLGTVPKCDVCQFHHVGQCRFRKCENCGKNGHSKETCWAGNGRGNGGQRGNGNGNSNGNHGGNGYGNRNQGGNGGNGNRGGSGNQAGNGNRGANNNQGGTGNRQGCFSCGDVGHFKRDCPKNNQAQGRLHIPRI